ncbi:aminotransferase class IV, partial [Candidatus Parcubacteria bacterium]|nr:aminotransferase class IV [Candidatus Parcubacteria bacterium]
EGPGENIFIIKNKKLFTPQHGSILPGITRSSVEEIARDLGIKTEKKEMTVEEVKSADEAFFSGTAAEIQPIGSIDDAIVGSGKAGEITTQIKDVYGKAVRGEDERYLKWLSFVYGA